MLILCTAVILGAVSFTRFLWFVRYNNRTWHAIIVHDWLTESVTILAEAIKQAVNFQIGIGGAMLAALAIERGEVLLQNAASLTTMHNGLRSGKLLSPAGLLYFTGSVRATRAMPRLGNVTISLIPWANTSGYESVYNASYPSFYIAPSDNEGNLTDQWRTTLCQLGDYSSETFSVAGGLISECKSNLTLPGADDSLDDSEIIYLVRNGIFDGQRHQRNFLDMESCYRSFKLWFRRKTTTIQY